MTKKLLFYIFTFFMLYGCASSYILSPSEHLYNKGNQFYDRKDYEQAIDLYEEMLSKSPNSKMATSAKINLGMAYYLTGQHEKAKELLNNVDIKNDSLKEHINNICKICDIEIAKKNGNAAPTEESPKGQETIIMKITESRLTDNGNLFLAGLTNIPVSELTVNNKKALLEKGQIFSIELYWKRGQEVSLEAKDEIGNYGKLNFYPDREAPQKPTGLRAANVSNSNLKIEWDENDDDDIYGYKIYYRLSGGSFNEIPELIADNEYEFVGLNNLIKDNNKTFEIHIKAVDRMRNFSENSNTLTVTLP